MCLFPRKNKNENGKAFQKGITEYNCGCCPECLSAKSRYWALRCSMQAKVSQGMMVTLTYDTYKRDINGNIVGEEDPNPNLPLVKAHIQRFIKRLRYYYPNNNLLYIATGERGKRTNRAHYHLVIFGVVFDDLRFYKKSKRGNIIYKSRTLEKIWKADKEHNGGICTVDSANINSAIARYCTKYCAKDSGLDDTFMLFSHGIGEEVLRDMFNGKPYIIDGKQYAIPKTVWKWYITNKYRHEIKRYKFPQDNITAYKNYEFGTHNARYFRSRVKNEIYYALRDNDILYKRYVQYQREKNELNDKYKKSAEERIRDLDNTRYFSYKSKCIKAFESIKYNNYVELPRASWEVKYTFNRERLKQIGLANKNGDTLYKIKRDITKKGKSFAPTPCHNTANDREKYFMYINNAFPIPKYKEYTFHSTKSDMYLRYIDWKIGEKNPFLQEN